MKRSHENKDVDPTFSKKYRSDVSHSTLVPPSSSSSSNFLQNFFQHVNNKDGSTPTTSELEGELKNELEFKRESEHTRAEIRRIIHQDGMITEHEIKQSQRHVDTAKLSTTQRLRLKVDQEMNTYNEKCNKMAVDYSTIIHALSPWGKRFEDEMEHNDDFARLIYTDVEDIVGEGKHDDDMLEELCKAKLYLGHFRKADQTVPPLLRIEKYDRFQIPGKLWVKYFECIFQVGGKSKFKRLHVDVPEVLLRHYPEYHPVIKSFFNLRVKPMKVKLLTNEACNIQKMEESDIELSDGDDIDEKDRKTINELNLFPISSAQDE